MDIVGILFKSKIRRNILIRFFADEGRKFYINEMARLVGTSQGTCRRELNNLTDAGILISSRTGNLQYYEININSPFHNEFKTIIQKTLGIEAILKEKLQGLKGITYAFIFGSYAKNELKPESDIDIVLIGNVSEDDLINKLREVEDAVGKEMNYHLYTLNEFKAKLKTDSFIMNIIKNYIMLTGDDEEFRKLLKET